VPLGRVERLDRDLDLGVLAGAAGLLLVRVVVLLDGLRIVSRYAHLRLADVRLDLELAPHAVDEDVEVQLAHAGDDRLPGLLVGADLEGRVLLGEALDRGAQLLLVALRLGSMATWMTGSGNVIDSRTTGLAGSHRVSPVVVSLRPMNA
jgi:hypothetical protein